MTVAPNATCPRCNGPATQAFSDVYCRADCTTAASKLQPNGQPNGHGGYTAGTIKITCGGVTMFTPPTTAPRRVAYYYSGANVALPHEVQGKPQMPSFGGNQLSCPHGAVCRGSHNNPTNRYYCWDCGAETADRP